MYTEWQENLLNWFITISLILAVCCYASASPQREQITFGKLYIEPPDPTVSAGENITFKCSYPANVTFNWQFHNDPQNPFNITNGRTTVSGKDNSVFWSEITFFFVPKSLSTEISCSVEGHSELAIAFLKVIGIKVGGACHSSDNCMTDRAKCLTGICVCPQNNVVLRLTESGYEVCREMIYKLYDPCEFSEQCYHLVDNKSICGPNGICTCAPWATDVNGKCIPRSAITYGRSQEMYRVGLIAVTCIIIVIVAVSLWITLRRSCREQNSVSQQNSVINSGEQTFSASLYDVTSDKPPSYDDVLDTGDTVGASPPDFKDALKHSITAKRLLRQSSAPAGQLLGITTSLNSAPYSKTGCDSPVFSHDES